MVMEREASAGLVKEILARGRFLTAGDRELAEMVGRRNLLHREMAQLLGIAESTVTRRVRRLWRRLAHPAGLREEFRQIGIEHFLQGMSGPALAEKHQMPPAQVRRILGFLRGWF